MKPWQEFEDAVAALLESSGMEIRKDLLVGHQQVDILATRRELGRTTSMAVECKAYERPLTKDILATTYVKYESLIENSLIDELLIVTSAGLASSAATYANSKRFLHHLTLDELYSTIIDFSRYLAHIQGLFADTGLSEYFIPLRIAPPAGVNRDAAVDAVTYIYDWLSDTTLPPLALISTYGTGKTTLSLYIAHLLAKEHRVNAASRIPILIDLGKVSDVQGLEGLLGKLMTFDNAVTNYSFPLFMELNRRGRFLIILDGFDEMKHGISWEAFMSNMEEIRRLVSPMSKLIICGRPSIFMDEAEHDEALQGRQKVGDHWVRSSFFGGFREMALQPLTREQISVFLRSYLAYLARAGHVDEGASDRIIQRMEEENSGALYDLASRPVQVNMLANVLPEWHQPLDRLSRTLLFDHFIDVIIARESKKAARMQISSWSRREFSRLLAWYMWAALKRDYIRADEIPDSVISEAKVDLKNSRAVRRELVAGCCLELKPPDLLRFAHRSLQEFLVAEEFALQVRTRRITITYAEAAMTPEIREFMQGIINGGSVEDFVPALLKHEGFLPPWWEQLFLRDSHFTEKVCALVKPGVGSPWPGVFLVWAMGRRPVKTLPEEVRRLASVGTRMYLCLAFHCLALWLFPRRKDNEASLLNLSFLEMIKEIVKTEPYKGKHSEGRSAVVELLRNIAIYPRGKTRLELGVLRKTLVEAYVSSACLSDIVDRHREESRDHLKREYDFFPLVPCSPELADEIRRFRERLETERQ